MNLTLAPLSLKKGDVRPDREREKIREEDK